MFLKSILSISLRTNIDCPLKTLHYIRAEIILTNHCPYDQVIWYIENCGKLLHVCGILKINSGKS